ncbi:MAG: hypothetical protein V3W34_02110 [Phycisphaerae bacterium]
MARPLAPCVQVNGRTVDGVWKAAKGFYIRNAHKQGTDRREFFTTIEGAIARRDHLAGILPTVPSRTREQAYQEALSHGIDPDYLDDHPDVVDSFMGGRKLNPAYGDRALALAAMFNLPADTFKPKGELAVRKPVGFTVKGVGNSYLSWYADTRTT